MKRLFQATWIFLLIMGNAYSADLHVPGQYPTIQEAIDAAGNGDFVIVEPGTYRECLLFDTGRVVIVRSTQGAEATVIDGMQANSVVRFLGVETENTILEGFTLTNGSGLLVGDILKGGGIYLGGNCNPTLKSLIIRDNTANWGGAVFGGATTATFDQCIISNNTAAYNAGGIYCNGSSDFKLLNSIITQNESSNRGGAIMLEDSSPIIVNCILSHNTAKHGAGIYCVGPSEQPAVINTNIVMNKASSSGSAFYCKTKATVTNSILWNYKAPGEDEIYAKNPYTFDITYSVIKGGWEGEGNIDAHPQFLFAYNHDYHLVSASPCIDAGDSACPYLLDQDMEGDPRIINGHVDIGADEFSTSHGYANEYFIPDDYATIQGAIDSSYPGDVFIVRPGTYVENLNFKGRPITIKSSNGPEQTTIDGNGGVVENRPVVRFRFMEQSDSVLQGFTLMNGSGHMLSTESYGGAVYCEEASPTFINLIFEHSRADYGGGFGENGSDLCELRECIFRSNQAQNGGGVYITGSAIIEDCTIEDNLSGGGIYANTNGTLTVRDNTIRNNQGGGGVECLGQGEFVIEDNDILNNVRDGQGGGIHINDYNGPNPSIIRNNRIIGNVADQGGGIFTAHDNILVTDNIIACNIVEGVAGGIKWTKGGTMLNTVICYNSATLNPAGYYGVGGGMLLQDATNVQIANCLIYNNTAERFGGGMFLHKGSNMVFDHLTIVKNFAEEEGSALYTSGMAMMTVSNSILRNEGRSEIYAESTLPTVVYSNIRNGWYGGTNIDVDPLFVNEAGNDYHLRYESPCRNAGSNDYVVTTEDFEGDPRIAYDIADMGADEFHPHLYYTGNAVPGGNIDLKFIGPPNDTIRLWVGAGVLEEPMQHPVFGDWYLESPILLAMVLGQIPSPDGVFVLPVTIPSDATSIEVPMQAGIGMLLSNPLVLEVQ